MLIENLDMKKNIYQYFRSLTILAFVLGGMQEEYGQEKKHE